jgi:hypothetical protein
MLSQLLPLLRRASRELRSLRCSAVHPLFPPSAEAAAGAERRQGLQTAQG